MFVLHRIVRNKAAEKAKHVHHQQQQPSPPDGGGGQADSNSGATTSLAAEQRVTSGYSINGILGIQHQELQQANGSATKRKRMEHGSIFFILTKKIFYGFFLNLKKKI